MNTLKSILHALLCVMRGMRIGRWWGGRTTTGRLLTVLAGNTTPVRIPEPYSKTEVGLIFTAVAALLLGTAVYLLDRDWANSMFLAPFAYHQWPRSAVFGAFGGFLPALLHAYAISVLILVALWPWPRTRAGVCLLWFIIASTLEWLQSDAADAWFFAGDRLPDTMPLLAYLESYAIHGQFDNIDLLATGAGCLTALAVAISITPHRQRTRA
jgi:hypothetical protein